MTFQNFFLAIILVGGATFLVPIILLDTCKFIREEFLEPREDEFIEEDDLPEVLETPSPVKGCLVQETITSSRGEPEGVYDWERDTIVQPSSVRAA